MQPQCLFLTGMAFIWGCSPWGIFMWICKAKIWQKSKERSSGTSYPCKHPTGDHHWHMGLGPSPFSPQRIWVLWILLLSYLLLPSALQVCVRNLLWKGNKDLQISRLLPLFLPPSTLLWTGSKKKDCRKIFFDQEQHHMVTLVLLHSLLFRRSLCTEEGNFIMIVCKDFQQSELMICRDYLVNCERYLICPATEEAQWLTVWGTTMIFARSTSHKREHLV